MPDIFIAMLVNILWQVQFSVPSSHDTLTIASETIIPGVLQVHSLLFERSVHEDCCIHCSGLVFRVAAHTNPHSHPCSGREQSENRCHCRIYYHHIPRHGTVHGCKNCRDIICGRCVSSPSSRENRSNLDRYAAVQVVFIGGNNNNGSCACTTV